MRFRVLTAAALAWAALALPLRADPLVNPDQTVPDEAALSAMTAAFVAAVAPFNGFLVASDRLAADHADSRIRAFAAREETGRAALLDALRGWADGVKRARAAEAAAPTIDRLGPIFGLLNDPIDVVVVPADAPQRRDLAGLRQVEGGAFDALYVEAQRGTLRELERNYVDYIKNGDDQVLRALSIRDLGRVRALLASLPRPMTTLSPDKPG